MYCLAELKQDFLGAGRHNGVSLNCGAVKAVKHRSLVQPSGHTYFFPLQIVAKTTDPRVTGYRWAAGTAERLLLILHKAKSLNVA